MKMFELSSNIKGGWRIIGGEGIESTSTSLKVERQTKTKCFAKNTQELYFNFQLKKCDLACPSRPDIDIDWLCMY